MCSGNAELTQRWHSSVSHFPPWAELPPRGHPAPFSGLTWFLSFPTAGLFSIRPDDGLSCLLKPELMFKV